MEIQKKEEDKDKDMRENTRDHESTQLLGLLIEAFVSKFFDNIDAKKMMVVNIVVM